MKKYLLIDVFFLLMFLIGCQGNNNPTTTMGLFDVSADDKNILFSMINGNNSAIYQIGINGKEFHQIASSVDSNFFNPKYSKISKKILFIGRPKNLSFNSVIYVANPDGTQIEKLTDGKEIISEAIFSQCEDKIYYCKANEYGHSSPIGSDEAHDLDIYSINLLDKKVEKVTNLNAYGIFHISEFDCKNILMFIPQRPEGGMVVFPKDATKALYSINPINNPRGDLSMYDTPVYSKKYNTLAFIATYELMIMSLKDKFAKVVINNSGKPQINNFGLFNNDKRIIYTTDDNAAFNIINYDGSGLTTIQIPINTNK